MADDNVSALEAFWEVYDPARVGSSGVLLKKYEGKEAAIFAKLEAKYDSKFFTVRRQLVGIFKQKDPARVATVDKLLVSKAKQEEALLAAVKKKFGVADTEPPAAEKEVPRASPREAPSQSPGDRVQDNKPADEFYKSIETFFKLYDPQNIGKVPTVVEKYRSRPKDFQTSLGKKYGKPYFETRVAAVQLVRGAGDDDADIDGLLYAKLRTGMSDDQALAALKKKYYGSGAPGGQAHRDRLVRFFQKYDATKVAQVDAILAKYSGKEEALLRSLVGKYGPEPPGPGEEPVDWEKRIRGLYSVYEPAKVGREKDLVAKYAGNERDVWVSLVRKYGPEPHWVDRIEKLLTKHGTRVNVENITQKLVEFAGREEELLQTYVDRYGPEGESVRTQDISFPAKVYRMYYQHNQEKLSAVPAILAKYKGQEDDIYKKLMEKYGCDNMAAAPAPTDYDTRIVNIYAEHMPDKLGNVPQLLQKYKGQEEDLIKSILAKYSITEPATGGAPALSYRERIHNIYSKYNKDKLGSIDAALARYAGHEEELIQVLVDRYGPEPAPGDEKSEKQIRVEQQALIRRYYRMYRPYEYDKLPKALQEWEGREEELLDVLRQEYGECDPDDTPEGPVTVEQQRSRRIHDDEVFEEEHDTVGGAFSDLLHDERTSRWHVEDEHAELWRDLLMYEADECIMSKQDEALRLLAARTELEYRKLVFRKWLRFVSLRMNLTQETCHQMMQAKLSVYDQMQTNKYSVAAYQREQRTRKQRVERRQRMNDKEALAREVQASPLHLPGTPRRSLSRPRSRGPVSRRTLNTSEGSLAPRRLYEPAVGGNRHPHFAKSAAELRHAAEERRLAKHEHEDILHEYGRSDGRITREAAWRRSVEGTGTGKRQAGPASPGTRRTTPKRRPVQQAPSPSYDEVMDAKVEAAFHDVSTAYPQPDFDLYAQAIQHATGTPETRVEREMRARRESRLASFLDSDY